MAAHKDNKTLFVNHWKANTIACSRQQPPNEQLVSDVLNAIWLGDTLLCALSTSFCPILPHKYIDSQIPRCLVRPSIAFLVKTFGDGNWKLPRFQDTRFQEISKNRAQYTELIRRNFPQQLFTVVLPVFYILALKEMSVK